MAEHTPGQWYAKQTLTSVGDEISWAVLCEKDLNAGFVVAMCYGPDAEANAQALVTARAVNKQLLEACLWALKALNDRDLEVRSIAEKMCKAAIAKATGGE